MTNAKQKDKYYPNTLYICFSLACRCSDVTKAINYKYFAIGFYGECWAGYDETLYNNLLGDFTQGAITCINGEYWSCENQGIDECTGGAHAEYVYKLISDEEGCGEEGEEEE